MDVHLDVKRPFVGGQGQRLLDDHDGRLPAEILFDHTTIDQDLARALLDEDTRHRGLATASAVVPVTNHRRSFRSRGP